MESSKIIKEILAIIESVREESSLSKKLKDFLCQDNLLREFELQEHDIPADNSTPISDEMLLDADEPVNEPKTMNELKSANYDLLQIISYKQEELMHLLESERYKDQLIKELHDELETFKKGLYETIKRPMIKSIISIHKRLLDQAKYYAHAALDDTAMVQKMTEDIHFNTQAILDTLEDEYDLTYFEPKISDYFDPKTMNVLAVENTDVLERDKTISGIVYGGYIDLYGKVFLKSNVKVYKHKG